MLRKRICSPSYFLQDYFVFKTQANMIIIWLKKTLYKVDFSFVFNKAKKNPKKILISLTKALVEERFFFYKLLKETFTRKEYFNKYRIFIHIAKKAATEQSEKLFNPGFEPVSLVQRSNILPIKLPGYAHSGTSRLSM